MGMIECRECKAHISSSAKSCPQCGYTGKQAAAKTSLVTWIAALVVGSCTVAAMLPKGNEAGSPTPPPAPAASPISATTPAPAPAPSGWVYSASPDKLTGKMTAYAEVKSANVVNFAFPYNGPQRGLLYVRKHPQHGQDVIFSIERGQLLCPAYDGCTIKIRFDDGAAETYSAAPAADNSTETLFISNDKRFIAAMKKAKRVVVQVNVYQEGQQVFEFDAPGLRWS